jgi:gluconolactonase
VAAAKITTLWVILFVMSLAPAASQTQVLRIYSALDDVVTTDARLEKLSGNPGIGILEGPVWVRKGGYLLFSDMAAKAIDKWNPSDGKVSRFLDRSGSNGVTLDPRGRVVYTSRLAERQIVRLEDDGRHTPLVSKFEGKRLNGPNDLVYKSDGALYFTDNTAPPPPLALKDKDPGLEIPFNGVYMLKDGKLSLLDKNLPRPNGIALSPDEKYLYVDDTLTKAIMRYELKPDDTVSKGQVWIAIPTDMPHLPDGMKVDKSGNVYGMGPGGVWIRSPNGNLLGIILTPTLPTNLAFGDPDGKALYMTTGTGLYRLRLKIAGIHP